MDCEEADDILGPVGLIPINREIISAVLSTRPETKNEERHRSGPGASLLSARSVGSASGGGTSKGGHDDSDEFVDAEEV